MLGSGTLAGGNDVVGRGSGEFSGISNPTIEYAGSFALVIAALNGAAGVLSGDLLRGTYKDAPENSVA
jgi:hypothetical protein